MKQTFDLSNVKICVDAKVDLLGNEHVAIFSMFSKQSPAK